MSRKTTRDLKPAPWGGSGYTRTRGYQIPSRLATRTPHIAPPYADADYLVAAANIALDVLDHLVDSRLRIFELIDLRAESFARGAAGGQTKRSS